MKHSKEHRRKIAEALKGRKHSKEHREKNRQSQLGKTMSKESREKMSWAKKGITKEINPNLIRSDEFKEKQRKSHIGISKGPPSEVTKKKIGKANSGKVRSKETRKQMSMSHMGMKSPKHSEFMKRKWEDPAYRDDITRKVAIELKRKPNKLEKNLSLILQKIIPNEYKFVGDGQFILAGRNPDFININGQKKIIELFGDYWHGPEIQGVSKEQHEQDRKERFIEYGYRTLIIWEYELKDVKELQKRLLSFNVL